MERGRRVALPTRQPTPHAAYPPRPIPLPLDTSQLTTTLLSQPGRELASLLVTMSVDRLLRRFKRRRSLRILLAALALYLLVRLGAFGNQHSTEGWISGAPDMPIIGVSQPASGRVPDAPLSGALARLRTKGDPETKAGEHEIKGGFLFVNMDLPASQHPIRQLIGAGKAAWESKLKRQSKTLKQAVREYKRRHGGRNPPKGFDKWWAYRECVLQRMRISQINSIR